MRLDNFSEYEKSLKKVYSICAENVCDPAEYYSTKKEALKICKKYKKEASRYNYSVDLLEWEANNKWYTFIECLLYI